MEILRKIKFQLISDFVGKYKVTFSSFEEIPPADLGQNILYVPAKYNLVKKMLQILLVASS